MRIILIALLILISSNANADVARDVKALRGGDNISKITDADLGNIEDIRVPESVNMRSTQEKFYHIDGHETVKSYKWAKNKLIKISTRVQMETMIVLPDYERIVTIYPGDKRFFKFARPENFPHMLALQATEEAIDTSLQVIAESGRIYLFYIRSLPIKTKATPDLLIYVDAPEIVSSRLDVASNISSSNNITHKAIDIANGLNQNNEYLHKLASGKKINGNYSIKGSKEIAPQAVYDDGQWTYFDFRNIPSSVGRPSLYRVVDKKQAIINIRRVDGHLVAETLSSEGWMLELGQKIVCIKSSNNHNFNVR